MIESFPYEAVPDGVVFAAHHFHYALIAGFLVALWIADDYPKREPKAVLAGILFSEFAFCFVWPFYPVTGASLSILFLAVATVSVTHGVAYLAVERLARRFPRLERLVDGWTRPYWALFPWQAVVVFICLLFAWDDLLNHAFGIPTPLDSIWNVYIYEHVP